MQASIAGFGIAALLGFTCFELMESYCPSEFKPNSRTCDWHPNWVGNIPTWVFSFHAGLFTVALPARVIQIRSIVPAVVFFYLGVAFASYVTADILGFVAHHAAVIEEGNRGIWIALGLSSLGGCVGLLLIQLHIMSITRHRSAYSSAGSER